MASGDVAWTDSHCHLGLDPEDTGVGELLAQARAARVARLVDVGTDLVSSEAAIARARAHSGVWATAGVHPHDAAGGTDGIEALLADATVVAVGECGLDYHYEHSPREAQRAAFAHQIGLAHRHDLALVVHSREAWDDTFAILRDETPPSRVVLHCFTGGPHEARIALDLGAHLSFSGIVTFKNASEVREAAALCPSDRLLVETDSPYLAPVPYRGRTNVPAHAAVVGEAVALVRDEAVEHVAATTDGNARRVFGLGDATLV